jgi:hypothetical protein
MNEPHIRVAADDASLRKFTLSERKEDSSRARFAFLRAIREASADPKRTFPRANDVVWPARVIDKLIDETKKRGIKERDIHQSLARRQRQVRHLERLRIDHKAPPTAKPQADQVKKVQRYVYVLEALAQVLGRRADDVLTEAFGQTTFFSTGQYSADNPTEELTFLLRELSYQVSRIEKLEEYFDNAYKTPALYDPVLERFCRGTSALPVGGYLGEGFAGDCWPAFEAPPSFPGAPIVRISRAEFSGPLHIESDLLAPADTPTSTVALEISPLRKSKVRPFGPGHTHHAKITLFTNIRFVIGPTTPAGDIAPMFELRSFVELKTDGHSRQLTFPYCLSPLAATEENDLSDMLGTVAAYFDHGWHRIGGFGTKEWEGTLEIPEHWTRIDNLWTGEHLLAKSGGGWEPLVQWARVDDATVTQLVAMLSELSSFDKQSKYQLLYEAKGPKTPEPTEYLFAHSGGQSFETALYTGAIEKALRTDCQRLKQRLADRVDQAKQTRILEKEALLKRWRTMGDDQQ